MKVWIETERKRRWWGGYRSLYVVCTEYMRWPHWSRREAMESAEMMAMLLKNQPTTGAK